MPSGKERQKSEIKILLWWMESNYECKNAASNLKILGLQSKDVEIKIKDAIIASKIMRIG